MQNIQNCILKKSSLLLFLLVFASSFAWAQEKTVSGTVTSSEDNSPIPGVNVIIQGTFQGSATDFDGAFELKVAGPDVVLEFSAIGFTSQTVTVGDQTQINVVMEPFLTAVDEVVVIGYGTQQKKEVTSSIVNVKSEEFNKGNVSNAEQLIQGKVSGLSINRAGGNPNAGFDIRLRGLNTVGANTGPLIVIDGVIGASLNNVDPNDIESMDVLKDGSAAAIYGTRGSSGVILVTTKKGRAGTSYVDYNGYVAIDMVAKTTDVMDAEQWRALNADVAAAGLASGTDFGENTNWMEEISQQAYSHVHNLALSGGTEKTSYRASINYRDQKGVMLNTGRTQLNGRLNLTQKALDDKLTLTMNLSVTDIKAEYGFDDAVRYATIYNPTAPIRSDDPQFDIYDGYFQQILYDYYNPIQILEQNSNDGQDRLSNISLRGAYEVIPGLTVDAFYSLQNYSAIRGRYYDKNSYWVGRDRNGLANRNTNISSNQLFESTVNYKGTLSSLNIEALGGYSYQDFTNEGFSAEGGNFLSDAFTYNNLSAALDFKNGIGTVTSYKNTSKLIAFFGRVNMNLDDTYFLSVSARYEGSSRFGADHKWGLFPAISAGVDISQFISNDNIDNLKLRANYGITGNQPSQNYLSLLRFGPQGNFYYNGAFVPGYGPVSNANSDLGWEKKAEIDVGVDFSFFRSKLYGSFDFYTRTTTDLLFQYEVPVPPNLYNQAWLNLGEIKSSGLELAVTFKAVDTDDFSYDISLTPSYTLENTLVSLSGSFNGAELSYGIRDLGAMGAPGQSDVPLVRAVEGEAIGQLWALVYKEIDADGNLTFEDVNEDGSVDTNDRQVVGNGLPNFLIGWGNNFAYKNWDANIFFRGVFGHDLINTYRAFYEVPNMINSYNLPTTAADMRNSSGVLMNSTSGVLSSYHVENGDFVSLDNLSIGYNVKLDQNSMFRKLRLYVAGNNLFYITGYKGVDPNPRYSDGGNTLIPGIDRRNTWFRTRSVSFGVELGL